ncbi:MAG: GNAT family N-acetyltransferase [Intrasporangium sp.]|nr:GNAT family N-acetyltransferase [Intrasporangium sp.]
MQELFAVVFGHDRGAEHHSWKFDRNPAGPPVVVVAQDGARIVGQYALWPMRLAIGTDLILGAQSLDTMTHPDYRGQGMFTALARECMDLATQRGIEVLFGFPNEASYPAFVGRLDWDHTGDVRQYSRMLKPSLHPRTPAWAGALSDAAARWLPRGGRTDVPVSGNPAPAELSRLAAARHDRQTCAVDRSPEYLAWRLGSGSGQHYEWVVVGPPEDPHAVAVWGKDPFSTRARLVELEGRTADALASAVALTTQNALQQGRSELLAFAQRPDLRAVLRRAGFVPRGGLPLIVRKQTGRLMRGNVHRHSAWSVFGSDLDTY